MTETSGVLPPLTRLIMCAEAIDAHGDVASRSGQAQELYDIADVLRQVYNDLSPAVSSQEETKEGETE